MNQVMLVGNVGRDAETVPSRSGGESVCKFSLATSEGGNKTEWHNIVAFKRTAELCGSLTKGQKVAIVGKIQTRSWEKDGRKHYATEIIADRVEFLSPKAQRATEPDPASDAIPF